MPTGAAKRHLADPPAADTVAIITLRMVESRFNFALRVLLALSKQVLKLMIDSDTVMSPKSWLLQKPGSMIERTINKLPEIAAWMADCIWWGPGERQDK